MFLESSQDGVQEKNRNNTAYDHLRCPLSSHKSDFVQENNIMSASNINVSTSDEGIVIAMTSFTGKIVVKDAAQLKADKKNYEKKDRHIHMLVATLNKLALKEPDSEDSDVSEESAKEVEEDSDYSEESAKEDDSDVSEEEKADVFAKYLPKRTGKGTGRPKMEVFDDEDFYEEPLSQALQY